MKVALVYDRVNKWGGAEQVLLALHEIWPKAPLYTSVYDQRAAPWADVFDVRTSFLQRLPLPKNAHEYYPYLMGPAFELFNFDEYDVVISVTHEFAKAIVTKPKTLHFCYCLTPTSYLWSGYKHYFSGHSALFRQLSYPLIKYLRWYDKIICHRPDKYIAISNTVRDRIIKYYECNSEVIYPPVCLGDTTPDFGLPTPDYFLIVSRLVSNKRLDIAVEAFNKLGLPLKIIGSGRDEQRLKNMAKNNINFLGHLTNQEMTKYYQSCLAVVIPGEEDFGIVSVEAQSFGKPVIAYRSGGSTETVVKKMTGYFFDSQTAQSLENAVKNANLKKIKPADCQINAERFSKARFVREFRKFVQKNYVDWQEQHHL